jgi:hypothetical protein
MLRRPLGEMKRTYPQILGHGSGEYGGRGRRQPFSGPTALDRRGAKPLGTRGREERPSGQGKYAAT